MKKILYFSFFCSLSLPLAAFGQTHAHASFFPPNSLRFPVDGKSINQGLSQEATVSAIEAVKLAYDDYIRQDGREFTFDLLWKSEEVNAIHFASRSRVLISIFGGIARHPLMSADGFKFVLCHELGHSFGGFPQKSKEDFASSEGQSDYYASLKCMRKVLAQEDNAKFLRAVQIPAVLKKACEQSHTSREDQLICMRSTLAGLNLGKILATLKAGIPTPDLSTPDLSVVQTTNLSYPTVQCRLDTFFQGALCTKPVHESLYYADEMKGTCNVSEGFTKGVRPACWFKPAYSGM